MTPAEAIAAAADYYEKDPLHYWGAKAMADFSKTRCCMVGCVRKVIHGDPYSPPDNGTPERELYDETIRCLAGAIITGESLGEIEQGDYLLYERACTEFNDKGWMLAGSARVNWVTGTIIPKMREAQELCGASS